MTPRISEAYFQELLHSTDPVEAVEKISMFWAHRLDGDADRFGLSEAEYVVQLSLIYTGEVFNGGHSQYFSNRGEAHVPDLINALRRLGFGVIANRLASVTDCETADLQELDHLVTPFFSADRTARDSLFSFDEALLTFIRDRDADILIAERGLAG